MAESVGEIYYTVDSRTQGLLDAERQVNRSTQKMERSFNRVDTSVQKTTASMGELKSIVTAVGGALAVQQVVRYADAWTNLQNQLRQVTETENERARVTQQLMGIANETRSSVESTANLYARLTRASSELGLSEQRRLRITKTINQAFAISGATAMEASAAITQLSQGLAAGALRGDEFNSVAEQAPMIMRAIADEAKMTIGELREFAAEGGITADLVVRALEGAADAMDTKFAKAAKSFGQNMEVANNNLTEFIGTSQAVSTVVTQAGETLVFFSENIDDIARLAGLAATVIGVRLVQALTASIARQAAATLGASSLAAAYSTMGARAAVTATAVRGLNAAMSLVGGPAGVAVLAAAAMVMYSDELTGTASQARRTTERVDELTNAINMNSEAAVRAGIVEMTARMFDLEQQAIAARDRIKEVSTGDTGSGFLGAAPGQTGEQVRAIQELGRIQEEMDATNQAAERLQKAMEVIRGGSSVGKVSSTSGASEQATKEAEKLRQQMDERRQALIQSLETESEQAYREYQERNVEIASLTKEGSARQQELYDRNNAEYLSKLQDIKARELETERAHIEELARLKEEARIEELERMDLFNEQAAQKIVELQERMKDPILAMKEELGTIFVNLDQTLSRAFANAIVEGESLKGALHQVGRTITAELLAGLIRVGLQDAINAAIGQSAQAATAAAAVGTAGTVAAAWAPAAAMASLASFVANAAPANAALAGTTALAQGLAIAGGRQYGGSVMGGSAYRVTEDGKPELLTQGTQQYLIPGRNGKVTSNNDMQAQGGGASMTVNVIEDSSRAGQTQKRTNPDGSQEADVFIADIFGNGKRSRALEKTYGLTRKGS